MKVLLITAATLLAGATTAPALADPRTPEPSTVAAAAAAAPAAAAARAEKPTRYCVVEEITGSRIPTKVCKTRAEWSDEGVNVDELGR